MNNKNKLNKNMMNVKNKSNPRATPLGLNTVIGSVKRNDQILPVILPCNA